MTTTTAPAAARLAADLAADLALDAADAAREVERTYHAISDHRAALSAAERAHEDAKTAAKTAAALPGELAKALGWPLGIVAEPPDTRYGQTAYDLRTPFAHGRVTNRASDRGAAPKGRSYGWVNASTDSRTAFDFEPRAGTRDPDKLAQQIADADANLRAWLSGFTADAWLTAYGIDPLHRPELVGLVTLAIDVRVRSDYHGGELVRWYRPVWSLLLGGRPITSTDDPRDLYTLDELRRYPGGHEAYMAQDELLGAIPSSDEEATRTWAVGHAERARAALLRRFTYNPDDYRR